VHQSLPILTHLQICEALDRVVGDLDRGKLIDFERSKNSEIQAYTALSDIDNLVCMNERLPHYLTYMTDQDMGCFPLVFGQDVRGDITVDDFRHITPK